MIYIKLFHLYSLNLKINFLVARSKSWELIILVMNIGNLLFINSSIKNAFANEFKQIIKAYPYLIQTFIFTSRKLTEFLAASTISAQIC